MRYIVTELGPIDRHAPGTDVTGMYSADVLSRLIDEGYIAEQSEAATSMGTTVAMVGDIDATENGGPDDEYSGVIVADIDEDEDGD